MTETSYFKTRTAPVSQNRADGIQPESDGQRFEKRAVNVVRGAPLAARPVEVESRNELDRVVRCFFTGKYQQWGQ